MNTANIEIQFNFRFACYIVCSLPRERLEIGTWQGSGDKARSQTNSVSRRDKGHGHMSPAASELLRHIPSHAGDAVYV